MVKKLFKPISVILMLVIMALTFSACASVRAQVITNADNTIDEVVSISLNAEEILNAGKSIKEVQDYIYKLSYAKADEMCDALNDKINTDLFLGVTEETAEILQTYKNGMEVVKADWQNNQFTIGVRFKNADVYKYYYGITEENNKPKYYAEEHFLYTKIYFYANTMYTKHHALYESVKQQFSLEMPELVAVDNCELLYTYVTESRREHSDADYIQKIGNEYYHTWIVEDAENEIITIYYNVANSGIYIIICIAIVLIVTLILLLVGLIITINKRKKLKNNENINKNIQN